MNDTPRKYPRTLNEAFGPYSGNHIDDAKEEENKRKDKIALIGCAAAAFALVVILWVS